MNSEQLLGEILAHWSDRHGLVSPYYQENPKLKDDCSGNGIFYTSQLVWLVYLKEKQLSGRLNQIVSSAFRVCEVKKKIGHLNRSATNNVDGNGPDDYIGRICASYIIRDSFRMEMYMAGAMVKLIPLAGILDEKYPKIAPLFNATLGRIKVRWVYNNVRPGVMSNSAWFGRFPHVIATLKFSKRGRVAFWQQIYWFIAVTCFGYGKNTDSWIQNGMMITASIGAGRLQDWAWAIWKLRLKRTWGSLGRLFDEHYHERHPLRGGVHPLRVYAGMVNLDSMA